MSSFTDAILLPTGQRREGRPTFRVHGGFYYEIGYLGSGLRVYVNDGYVTDLGSIPALARLFVPKDARRAAIKAFCIHDVLREDERFTLLETDAIFLMAMEAEGTPKFWRNIFYNAVRTNSNRTKHNGTLLPLFDIGPGHVVNVAR